MLILIIYDTNDAFQEITIEVLYKQLGGEAGNFAYSLGWVQIFEKLAHNMILGSSLTAVVFLK